MTSNSGELGASWFDVTCGELTVLVPELCPSTFTLSNKSFSGLSCLCLCLCLCLFFFFFFLTLWGLADPSSLPSVTGGSRGSLDCWAGVDVRGSNPENDVGPKGSTNIWKSYECFSRNLSPNIFYTRPPMNDSILHNTYFKSISL